MFKSVFFAMMTIKKKSFVILFFLLSWVFCEVKAQKPLLVITDIQPTVFFKEQQGQLMQKVNFFMKSDRQYQDLQLQIERPGQKIGLAFPDIDQGTDTLSLLIPDIRDTARLAFSLLQKNRKLVSLDYDWIPQRHWEIYMVHSSHHDLGYTDLPDRVLEEHKDHITQAIKYCEQTEDWPEHARFHYVIEQAWSAAYFMEHTRDEILKEKFVHYLKNGQLELTALFGNQNTDMSGTEELNRLVYPSFALAKQYGFEISSAETNDMPGIHWGLVSVLHEAGVKYLYAGIQDYFKWGDTMPAPWDEEKVMRRDISEAFYWQGPADHKVMFWYGGGSLDNVWVWEYDQAEDELARHLQHHQEKGYPYDMLLVRVLGGYRDNSLPDMRHSEIIREWNENWTYPNIRFSNNKTFFTTFEEKHGSSLKTVRGDFNQTDYNIGAISTPKETAQQRHNQRMITSAETFSVLAAQLTDYVYPRDQLNESYERLFLYNEHCWGLQHPSGQAQLAANSQKANHAFQAGALIEDLNVKALNKLADQVNLEEESYHLIVFNPLSHRRSDVVTMQAFVSIPAGKPFFRQPRQFGNHEVMIWRAAEAADRKLYQLPDELLGQPFQLIDVSSGKVVPHQLRVIDDPHLPVPDAASRLALSQVSQNSVGGLNYKENQAIDILFFAEDIPAMGYKTFRIEPLPATPSAIVQQNAQSEDAIENDFYKVSLQDKQLRIYDKSLNKYIMDENTAYSAAELLVRSVADARVEHPILQKAEVVNQGPVFSTIRLTSGMDKVPIIVQEFRLFHDIKRIEVATRMLKDASPFFEYYLAFPFTMDEPEFRLSSVNSMYEPIVDQLPGTHTDAYTAQSGLSMFNDEFSIHWNSADAPIIRIGELWPGYVSQAHHGKTPLHYLHEFADTFSSSHLYSLVSVNNFRTNFSPSYTGDLLFRYTFTSEPGSYDAAKAYQYQQAASHPLMPVVIEGAQAGRLGKEFSFLEVDRENVEVVTLKAAENGEGMVLRLRETAGQAVEASIRLNGISFSQVATCNLQEEVEGPLPVSDDSFSLSLAPYEIKTISLQTVTSFPQRQYYFHSY